MSPALDLMNSAPAPDDLVGEWGSGNSSSPPTTGVPLIDGDRVSDFWLNTLILVQLLLLGVAWYLRLPALKNGRRPDIKPNEALLTPPRPAPILRIVHAVCCIALAVQYALALVYDSSASHQTFHGGPASGASAAYFKACWAIAIGMWLACTVLVLAEARASLHASVSLRLWWVLNGVLATARFASDLVKVTDDDGAPAQTPTLISAAFFFPSLLLFLLALLEADTPSDRSYLSLDQPLLDEEAERARTLKMNREATASFASRLTFSWLGGVLATGSKRSLEHSDLFALQTRDGSGHNAAHLMRCWEAEAASGRKNFLRSFWVAFGPYFARTGFLKLINDGCVFLNPIFINKIVAYIEGTNDMSNAAAILCAFGMLAANQTVSLVLGQYFFRGYRQSLRVRAAVGQVVYEKALSLDHEQRQTHSVGAIVSHMQIDAQKLGDALPYLHMIWSGPLQLAIAITMLYNYLGPSGFMGLAVMVMMLPLNMKLGAKIGKYSLATMGARDKRVKFTNELLQGMRILKLFAWEKPLLEQLHQKRDKELSNIRANLLLGGVIGFLFTATPLLVTLCTFAVYTILGNKLTAATAFTALSLFNILRFPLLVIPMMITRVIDLMVVNKRLSKFMSAPARKTVFLNDGDGSVAPSSSLVFDGHYMAGEPARDGAAAIEMVNGTFKWPAARKDDDAKKGPKADGASQKAPARRGFFRGKRAATEPLVPPAAPMSDDAAAAPAAATSEEEMPPTLSDVSVELKRGMLVGVAGPVGSGKTSLLHALLGDIPQLAGRVVVRGSVAYCAQEPWIQNMSLRDNVLFGTPFDATRYARVLSACALDADLQALPNGDATEIGERGINLSGGQKARVALARACYVRADTILLDDVLSAVDAEVGATLMQKCICGLLRERGCTVVFVTHHVQWLSSCDYTMQLDAGGKVKDQGTPSIMRRVGSASTLGGEASIDIPEGAPPSLLGGAGGALSAANGLQSSSKDATKPPGISRRDTPGTTSVKASLQRQAEDKDKSKGIIQQEERARGVVSLEVWSKYFSALGCVSSVALFLMYTSAQALTILSSWWLGQWAELAHETLPDNPPFQQTSGTTSPSTARSRSRPHSSSSSARSCSRSRRCARRASCTRWRATPSSARPSSSSTPTRSAASSTASRSTCRSSTCSSPPSPASCSSTRGSSSARSRCSCSTRGTSSPPSSRSRSSTRASRATTATRRASCSGSTRSPSRPSTRRSRRRSTARRPSRPLAPPIPSSRRTARVSTSTCAPASSRRPPTVGSRCVSSSSPTCSSSAPPSSPSSRTRRPT